MKIIFLIYASKLRCILKQILIRLTNSQSKYIIITKEEYEIMENITNLRKALYEKYVTWNQEIFKNPTLSESNISLPYYIYLPDNWSDSKMRILIVGEEGFGRKGCERDRDVVTENIIETVQEFNKTCMFEWKMNNRPFWRRFNKLRENLSDASFCWTNIDKVHRLIDPAQNIKRCKLLTNQRAELHKYPILQSEIDTIKPTHIIFFGWYGYSLNFELPEIYSKLYKDGKEKWVKDEYCTTITEDNGIKYIFTYHPNWCVRNGHEKNIIYKILSSCY